MPATEKTWRDQARMHVIFGISALVMLVGTIWMLAKDHNREWRRWQLADRAKERWAIEAQLAQAEADSTAELDRLRNELFAARSTKVDAALVERFKAEVAEGEERLAEMGVERVEADFASIDRAMSELQQAEEGSEAAKNARERLLRAMNHFTHNARRREDALLQRKKFRNADLTAAVSRRGIAIGEGRSTDNIESEIEQLSGEIAEIDVRLAAAKDHRLSLEAIMREVQAAELEVERQIAAIETDLNRLHENLRRNPASPLDHPGEWINRAPVLDALYTGNIKLDQIWLPEMTINYNFSDVARYDRCIVCHRAIDATAPGSATEPAYPPVPRGKRERIVQLATPEEPPTAEAKVEGATASPPTITSVYGIKLAPYGQIAEDAVTIQVVAPKSLAAMAGLQTGDIIEQINGGPIRSDADVDHYLLDFVQWGQPVTLQIRRGLDQPFTSHPRLDLFVGPNSPHKMGEMGCTICHDGQGSATEFKWASHTPDDPEQALDWSRKYGWFDNHHWIFPMTPARFIESNCLKCHHEVVDLEPSERFPEPPAPKLVQGYHLVREFGCYGCHEITGYDGPNKRIGPDLRTEPNYSEVAAQILSERGLNEEERQWATTIVQRPDNAEVRHLLMRSIRADAANGAAQTADRESEDAKPAEPRLSPATHELASALADVDVPGNLRNVGPSLRHLDSKVDYNWLVSWIRRPSDFRPDTRMPQFFLNHQHLDDHDKGFTIHDVEGNEQKVTDREYTERFENIEVRALSEFLLANSQPFEYLDQPQGVTEQPSAERGKWLFESRGCLACHAHAEFPGIHSTQGPDLSRISAKFNSEKGARWLYTWIRQPNHYHPRTAMPDVFLDPIEETDASGQPTGRVTDPAADIVTYLLGVPTDWKPEYAVGSRELTPEEQAALNDLTTVWLSASFPRRRAERFAKEGIPERLAATVKVDERVLVGMTDADRTQRQLEYVARRSLSRYGCFGCHDIPGFETAKPIGTPLANWGRKDPAQLAFENIGHFLATHGIDGTEEPHDEHGGGHGLDPLDDRYTADEGYFLQALNRHQRQGFLWQKLRMPRSFDYATTRTKRYDERLRMPKFPFDDEQREAVMTFILGLTSEAPAERYIYKPGPREEAIVQGRHVLDKYNCAGCHVLDMERWDIAFEPDWFGEPPTTNDFPFLHPNFTSDEIAASLETDRRGLMHAELHGMPARDEETGQPRLVDMDGIPLEADDTESEPYYEFQLYMHALVSGDPRLVGLQPLFIAADRQHGGPRNGTAYPGVGGDLAKYLYPRAITEERKVNPSAVATEAWGWLPPPLHHEGVKVQTDWLHDFLMDPTPIRPAVVMRMPNFHMTDDEAGKLVNYFAAKSDAQFPYEYNQRRRGQYLAQLEQAHPELLNDAMKIVTDGNYCVKCHSVGDYQAVGAIKTQGPKLDEVYRRLRPEYTRRWIANPQRILPYTGMPVNIPYDPSAEHLGGVSQALFPGTSVQQLDGVVDLLMNFDEYAKRQTSIRSMVREAAPAEEGQQPAASSLPPDDRSARR